MHQSQTRKAKQRCVDGVGGEWVGSSYTRAEEVSGLTLSK